MIVRDRLRVPSRVPVVVHIRAIRTYKRRLAAKRPRDASRLVTIDVRVSEIHVIPVSHVCSYALSDMGPNVILNYMPCDRVGRAVRAT